MNRPPKKKRRPRYDDDSYFAATLALFTCLKCNEPVMIAHHRMMPGKKALWCHCSKWAGRADEVPVSPITWTAVSVPLTPSDKAQL